MKEEKGKASPKTSTGGEKEASQTNIDQCFFLLPLWGRSGGGLSLITIFYPVILAGSPFTNTGFSLCFLGINMSL